ncbi:50S ribosomal protein L3, partial [Chlamydia psittaci 06-1683]
MSSTKME